jgi:hypothetical protein
MRLQSAQTKATAMSVSQLCVPSTILILQMQKPRPNHVQSRKSSLFQICAAQVLDSASSACLHSDSRGNHVSMPEKQLTQSIISKQNPHQSTTSSCLLLRKLQFSEGEESCAPEIMSYLLLIAVAMTHSSICRTKTCCTLEEQD